MNKNQIVVISGIFVLLATVTITAASYSVQPAEAQYGKTAISQFANPNVCLDGQFCGSGFGTHLSQYAQGTLNAGQTAGVSNGAFGRAPGCDTRVVGNNFPITQSGGAVPTCPPG